MAEEGFDALLLTRPESIRYATGVTSAFMYLNIPIGNVIGIVPRFGNAAVVMSSLKGMQPKLTVGNRHLRLSYFRIHRGLRCRGTDQRLSAKYGQGLSHGCGFIKDKIGNVKKSVSKGPCSPMTGCCFCRTNSAVMCRRIVRSCSRRPRNLKRPGKSKCCGKMPRALSGPMSYVAKHTEIGMDEQDILLLMNQGLVNEGKGFCSTRQCNVVGEQFSPIYLPHTCYKLKEGDTVRLDGGINSNAYSSDISRTYFVGKKSLMSGSKSGTFFTIPLKKSLRC